MLHFNFQLKNLLLPYIRTFVTLISIVIFNLNKSFSMKNKKKKERKKEKSIWKK